ncbi:hypothetical protein [Marispirochaeta aestuarii]|uniref:hypothetical protein n=1 Tax=Marispirochaeta aestuarii TaxID=1963862 RepID=UPI0029C9024B|nr:hypothetical protein [Marispirochaeta aestuarii]
MKKRRFHSGLILYGILMLIIAGFMVSCNGGGSGSDDIEIPAVVGANITDEDLGTDGIQYTFFYIGSSFNIQLELDSNVTALETILFRSLTPLPGYLSLDSNTGIITVTPDNSEHSDTVEFWSEGATSGDDTSAQSLRIDFTASSS